MFKKKNSKLPISRFNLTSASGKEGSLKAGRIKELNYQMSKDQLERYAEACAVSFARSSEIAVSRARSSRVCTCNVTTDE